MRTSPISKSVQRARFIAPLQFVMHVCVLLSAFLLSAVMVGAQDSAPRVVSDDEVNALANRLFCPVCPNETLDACQTQACANWREEIRVQLANGATEQDVIDNFVARFGERVIGTPQDPALRALSLVTPVLIGVIAVVVGVVTFTRWRGQRRITGSVSDAGQTSRVERERDQDYRRLIEDDLK